MNYDSDILYILAEAGSKGLSLKKIAMHVYNRVNGLFSTVDYKDVYRYVANYIARNSAQANPLIEHTSERGVYRLNDSYADSSQQQFNFKDAVDCKESGEAPAEDTSLPLFGEW